jgi:hypothetical protein
MLPTTPLSSSCSLNCFKKQHEVKKHEVSVINRYSRDLYHHAPKSQATPMMMTKSAIHFKTNIGFYQYL